MPTLLIDTSTPRTWAALLADDETAVLAEESSSDRAQSVLVIIDALCARAGVSRAEIARVAVGSGPGGFTGLRVGVATARGLASALGVPIAMFDTLGAIAASATPDDHVGTVVAVSGAQRGELFVQRWQFAGDAVPEPVAANFDVIPEGELEEWCGADTQARGDITASGVARLVPALVWGGVDSALPVYGRAADAVPPAPVERRQHT